MDDILCYTVLVYLNSPYSYFWRLFYSPQCENVGGKKHHWLFCFSSRLKTLTGSLRVHRGTMHMLCQFLGILPIWLIYLFIWIYIFHNSKGGTTGKDARTKWIYTGLFKVKDNSDLVLEKIDLWVFDLVELSSEWWNVSKCLTFLNARYYYPFFSVEKNGIWL